MRKLHGRSERINQGQAYEVCEDARVETKSVNLHITTRPTLKFMRVTYGDFTFDGLQ